MYWKIRNLVSAFVEVLQIYRRYVVLVVLLVSSLILLQTNTNPQMTFVRRQFIVAAAALGERFTWLPRTFHGESDDQELEQRQVELAKRNILLEDAYLENIRLRHLLRFMERFPLRTLPAQVVMVNPSPSRHSIILNRGTKDGVRLNHNVITDRGLVGRIRDVGTEHAECQLMLDKSFRVAAKIQRTRLNGIVHWQGQSNEVGFYGVLKNLDVQIGDVILTSEYSEYFLPNFRIGVVVGINNEIAGIFKDIHVRTYVDFNTLEEVFVVMDTTKELSAGRNFEKNFFGNP